MLQQRDQGGSQFGVRGIFLNPGMGMAEPTQAAFGITGPRRKAPGDFGLGRTRRYRTRGYRTGGEKQDRRAPSEAQQFTVVRCHVVVDKQAAAIPATAPE